MTAPPDKLLPQKAVLRVGAACWCFGTALFQIPIRAVLPFEARWTAAPNKEDLSGAAGVILDCACAPILMGTAAGTSAKPSPLPTNPAKGLMRRAFPI